MFKMIFLWWRGPTIFLDHNWLMVEKLQNMDNVEMSRGEKK